MKWFAAIIGNNDTIITKQHKYFFQKEKLKVWIRLVYHDKKYLLQGIANFSCLGIKVILQFSNRNHPFYSDTHLEIVGEFGPPCVAWVHGDEDGTGWVQSDVGPLKHEHLHLLGDCPLYGLYLLGYHRQHL